MRGTMSQIGEMTQRASGEDFRAQLLDDDDIDNEEDDDDLFVDAYTRYDSKGVIVGVDTNTDFLVTSTGAAGGGPMATGGQYERWGKKERTSILVIVGMMGFVGTMAASTYYPLLPSITEQFGLDENDFRKSCSVAVFSLLLAVLPLGWGPASDRFGRRWIIVGSLGFYTLISYATAFCTDIYWMIAARALAALPISSLLVVATGIISDVFPPSRRASALVRLILFLDSSSLISL